VVQRARQEGVRSHNAPGGGLPAGERDKGGAGACERHAHNGVGFYKRQRERPASGLREMVRKAGAP